jgi:hypothetical protein
MAYKPFPFRAGERQASGGNSIASVLNMPPTAFLHLNFLVEPAKYKSVVQMRRSPNMSGHALRARTSRESIFEPVELVPQAW